ncbi:MAG: hypothetical protein Q8O95_05300 [bacterium]|nr:hypothetical protein [bacterium]
MAATPQAPTREDLEKTVKQLIMLSIGLEFEEKDKLIRKLPSLTGEQLGQLKLAFDEENERKDQMLSDFFGKNPELFPEFERFSKDHVNSIFRNVEKGELVEEQQKMEKLLQSDF